MRKRGSEKEREREGVRKRGRERDEMREINSRRMCVCIFDTKREREIKTGRPTY